MKTLCKSMLLSISISISFSAMADEVSANISGTIRPSICKVTVPDSTIRLGRITDWDLNPSAMSASISKRVFLSLDCLGAGSRVGFTANIDQAGASMDTINYMASNWVRGDLKEYAPTSDNIQPILSENKVVGGFHAYLPPLAHQIAGVNSAVGYIISTDNGSTWSKNSVAGTADPTPFTASKQLISFIDHGGEINGLAPNAITYLYLPIDVHVSFLPKDMLDLSQALNFNSTLTLSFSYL